MYSKFVLWESDLVFVGQALGLLAHPLLDVAINPKPKFKPFPILTNSPKSYNPKALHPETHQAIYKL